MKTSKVIKNIEKQMAFFRSVRKDGSSVGSGVALGLEIALEIINASNIKKAKTDISPEAMEKKVALANHARAVRMARIAEKKANKSS
jgi:hypothetical protein